jgi:hypothetical protein
MRSPVRQLTYMWAHPQTSCVLHAFVRLQQHSQDREIKESVRHEAGRWNE